MVLVILFYSLLMSHFFFLFSFFFIQVTNGMFSATRKKFVEGVESDYPDESVYYGQPSMFPHRSEKDVNTTITSCCY